MLNECATGFAHIVCYVMYRDRGVKVKIRIRIIATITRSSIHTIRDVHTALLGINLMAVPSHARKRYKSG